MKIVRNNCFGGFSLSPLAVMEYAKLKGIELFIYKDINHYPCMDYVKVNSVEDVKDFLFVYYATKDLGERCSSKELNDNFFNDRGVERNDPCLVEVVEKLGEKANGRFAELIVVEIPDGIEWDITEYDGLEKVEEVHRSW